MTPFAVLVVLVVLERANKMNVDTTLQTLELLESNVFLDIDRLYHTGVISQYEYHKMIKDLCEHLDLFRATYEKYTRVYGEK